MAIHDHVNAGTCIYCALKHLGVAKVKIGEALASADPRRRKTRLVDALAEMTEAETTHLGQEYPEMATKVRDVRKSVEAATFEGGTVDVGEVDEVIGELLELEASERRHEKGKKTPVYTEKAAAATPERVLEAIEHYKEEYGAPASLSDIQFLLTIPHGSKLDRQIDRAFAKVPMAKIESTVEKLEDDGLVQESEDGGYLARERTGAQAFNIPEANNHLKMLKGSDVGLIAGSALGAKGTEALATWADNTYGLSAQPLHGRISTYIPLIGALALVAAAKAKYFKQDKHREAQMAAAVYGAHLLAQGVDVVQQATTPGVTFGLVPVSPRAVVQPGLTAAPTPGYLPIASGVGGLRDIF